MSTSICLWKRQLCCGALGLVLAMSAALPALAQGSGISPDQAGYDSVVPASYTGSGSFFNRKLGTALRFSYHTEGYGTQEGVVSIGGMKVMTIDDSSTWFIDGQGTLSDDFGGGFNLGLGYRVLMDTEFGYDPQRIYGFGFWTDGQSTNADNFFTQLGFNLESLGDELDFRLTGSFPLERTQRSDPVLTSLTDLSFVGTGLFSGREDVTIDTSHSVIDGEIAKRILDLEAWAFLGGYHIGSGGLDTGGYRAGVRGYAMPDLSVSLQVTDDDIYHTNVMFGITWFVGRTNRCNQPCGTILDRFREPVLRNDFIVTSSTVVNQAAGSALTDTETNATMRIVHVDSTATGTMDGTFENPFDTLAAADGVGSLENDKILVHSGSTFTGATGSFTAQNGQDILGEGLDANGVAVSHIVSTVERGLITLPETSTGSSTGATPTITGAGDIFTLADNNAVNNFVVNGATRAVVANGVASPTLANLDINGTTGNAIEMVNVTGTTVVENTVTIDDAASLGGAALFIDGGLDGMSLAATINDSRGRVLEVRNRTGGTITYTGTVEDNTANDGTFSDGILIEDNTNATVTLTGRVDLDTDASNAVTINGNNGASGADAGTIVTFDELVATSAAGNTVDIDDGGTVTFNNTNSAASITNTGAGNAVNISGDLVAASNAVVTIAADISNSTGGRALEIRDRTANDVTVTGSVTGSADGILFQDNSAGQYSLTGNVNVTATTGDALTMTDNQGASVSLTDAMLSTTSGNALNVTGGGTLTITDPLGTNTISAINGGTAVKILGNANGDAVVAINAAVSSTGTGRSVDIQGRGSNDVTFNGTVSDQGTGLFVSLNTGGNIVFTNTVTTNVTGANNGINLLTNTGTTISFNGLDINATTGKGFTATGGGNLLVTSPAGTNTIATTTGIGLELNGISIDVGNARFDSVTVTGGAAEGILLNTIDGTGQLTIGGGTLTTAGTAISINNANNVALNDIAVANAGTAGAGLVVTNSAGDTVAIQNLDVTTSTGQGVSVTGGGTLTATGTSDIATTTGTGLTIDGVTIGGTGASFNSVNVNGATNGIVLNNATGGQIRVGAAVASGVDGAGGTLTTTGTAISVTGVNNAVFNDVTTSVGGAGIDSVVVNHTSGSLTDVIFDNLTATTVAGGGRGVVVQDNGTGELDVILRNSTIDASASNTVAFELETAANLGEIDISLINNTINAGDESSVAANLNSGTGDVQFLITGNSMTNSSAANATVDLMVQANRTLNATIGDQVGDVFTTNSFSNGGTAAGVAVETANASARINLDLRGNTAASAGALDFVLTETTGTFGVVDLTATVTAETNNQGVVDLSGGVEADFDDLTPPIKQVD